MEGLKREPASMNLPEQLIFKSLGECIAQGDELPEKFLKMAEDERRRYESEKESHFLTCGVKRKYRTLRFEDFKAETDEQKNALKIVLNFIKKVKEGLAMTLWLCGANGTGKTFLGSMICLETLGTFIRTYDIDDALKDAMSFSSKRTRREVFQEYADAPLLVIDEIGRFQTQSEKENLFHILNDRYENDFSTVLISNLGKQALAEYLGRALTDRFFENCTTFEFKGNSYRRKIGEERLKK